MHTKSGMLVLTKKERRALESVLEHAKRNHYYGVDGSYGDAYEIVEKKEHKEAPLGFEVIEFVLNITK